MGLLDLPQTVHRDVTNKGGLLGEQKPGYFARLTKDPLFRLGLALMEQGGPQARPHNTLQDISRAFGSVQAQSDEDQARTLQREELDRRKRMNEAEERQRQQSEGFMASMQPVLSQILGNGEALVPGAQQPAQQPMPMDGAQPASQPAPQGDPNFRTMANEAATAAGIDPALFHSLIDSESAWNPKAVSPKGAIGLAQLMPPTAKELGVDPNDPMQNLQGGARYLRQQIDRFGNPRDALRAYNAGPGNASMSPTMSAEYADKILGRLPQGQQPPAPQPQGPVSVPKPIRDQLLLSAYQQSGGDPVKMMQAFGKAMQDYTIANAKTLSEIGPKRDQAILESTLAAGRDKAKSDRTFSEEEQKLFAKDFMEINEKGKAAAGKAAKIATLGNLLNQTYTGAAGETIQDLLRIGAALGLEVQGVAEGDAARAIANGMALDLRATGEGSGMPGALSDKDREFLVAMAPGLTKTPEGNALLVDYWKRLAKREQQVASKAREYKRKNGGRFDDGFYDELATWAEANPLFPDGGMGGSIPQDAINRLKMNPKEAPQFDEIFGIGASKRVLGQ